MNEVTKNPPNMGRVENILNQAKSVFFFFFLTFIACGKEDPHFSQSNLCGVKSPTENLEWLKEAIEEVRHDEYSYYSTALYQGERVFFYGNCNPAVNYVSLIRNCSGDKLGNTNELYDSLSAIEVAWKHEESKCNF